MSNPTTSALSAPLLTIRNTQMLPDAWQGGSALLYDLETAPGVNSGIPWLLGNITKADFESKAEATDFDTAMSTGVLVTEGKPIKKLNTIFSATINAPSLHAMSLAMFAGGTVTSASYQAAVSTDTAFAVASVVLGVWYKLPVSQISAFVVGLTSSFTGTPTTYTEGTDYVLDSELGAVQFLAGGAITAASAVTCFYQASAITGPQISPLTNVRFTYGKVYVYMVVAANEARTNPEIWLRYIPRARLEPSGKFDFTADKPGEVTFTVTAVPSTALVGQPYGYLQQIGGTAHVIR